MSFDEAYKLVLEMWPTEINITNIKFHSNGGARIQELINYHDKIEEQCIPLGKEAIAMDWSLFQYFHAHAKELYKNNIFTLTTSNVDIKAVKELYDENNK